MGQRIAVNSRSWYRDTSCSRGKSDQSPMTKGKVSSESNRTRCIWRIAFPDKYRVTAEVHPSLEFLSQASGDGFRIVCLSENVGRARGNYRGSRLSALGIDHQIRTYRAPWWFSHLQQSIARSFPKLRQQTGEVFRHTRIEQLEYQQGLACQLSEDAACKPLRPGSNTNSPVRIKN